METKSTLDLLLNGMSLQQFTVFFILGMVGVVGSMIMEMYKKRMNFKAEGKSFDFSMGYWIKDNAMRFILSTFAVIVGILFTKDVLDTELNNFTAFLAGFNTDKIIETFKAKINLKS